MNKFAELKYGKVINLFEDFRTLENWREVHSPDKYWVDVTHLDDIKVGDVLDFKDGIGLVFKHSVSDTLEDIKKDKLSHFKNQQYQDNNAAIEWEYKFFDYDNQAKWKILERIYQMKVMGVEKVTWKTADNEEVELTVSDLESIISCGACRTDLLHVKYNHLKKMVEKCSTVEELDSVEW